MSQGFQVGVNAPQPQAGLGFSGLGFQMPTFSTKVWAGGQLPTSPPRPVGAGALLNPFDPMAQFLAGAGAPPMPNVPWLGASRPTVQPTSVTGQDFAGRPIVQLPSYFKGTPGLFSTVAPQQGVPVPPTRTVFPLSSFALGGAGGAASALLGLGQGPGNLFPNPALVAGSTTATSPVGSRQATRTAGAVPLLGDMTNALLSDAAFSPYFPTRADSAVMGIGGSTVLGDVTQLFTTAGVGETSAGATAIDATTLIASTSHGTYVPDSQLQVLTPGSVAGVTVDRTTPGLEGPFIAQETNGAASVAPELRCELVNRHGSMELHPSKSNYMAISNEVTGQSSAWNLGYASKQPETEQQYYERPNCAGSNATLAIGMMWRSKLNAIAERLGFYSFCQLSAWIQYDIFLDTSSAWTGTSVSVDLHAEAYVQQLFLSTLPLPGSVHSWVPGAGGHLAGEAYATLGSTERVDAKSSLPYPSKRYKPTAKKRVSASFTVAPGSSTKSGEVRIDITWMAPPWLLYAVTRSRLGAKYTITSY